MNAASLTSSLNKKINLKTAILRLPQCFCFKMFVTLILSVRFCRSTAAPISVGLDIIRCFMSLSAFLSTHFCSLWAVLTHHLYTQSFGFLIHRKIKLSLKHFSSETRFSSSEALQQARCLSLPNLSSVGEKWGTLLRTIKSFESPAADTRKIRMEVNIKSSAHS